MSVDALCQALPDYAKDLRANLASVAGEPGLSDPQKWGCLIASAHAVGTGVVIRELEDGCPLSTEERAAAKSAAALMAMNNVYYRALHIMKNREYATLPARLKMSAIAQPGADRDDFELWCLAVSALNGCGACLDSHEDALRKRGIGSGVVQGALRIAAVVNAVSRVLAAEEAAKA
jgi:lipoyl-dependent peroxiredoxin subunit D